MQEHIDYIYSFEHDWLRCLHTGSRVICDPPVEGTDDDYILLVHPMMYQDVRKKLRKDGFRLGGSKDDLSNHGFDSLKRGQLNVILTQSEEFFESSVKAHHLCKYLNLLDKNHRIAVFRAVRDDKWVHIDYSFDGPGETPEQPADESNVTLPQSVTHSGQAGSSLLMSLPGVGPGMIYHTLNPSGSVTSTLYEHQSSSEALPNSFYDEFNNAVAVEAFEALNGL